VTRGPLILAIAAAVAVAGCGGDDSSSAPAPPQGTVSKIGSVIDSFQAAAAGHDGAGMCDVLTASLKQRVEDQGGGQCASVMAARLADPYSSLTVRQVTIQPSTSRAGAQVTEKGGAAATMFFVAQGDRWLVDAIRRPGTGTPLK
jgi:hypothetical protein